MCCHKIAHWIRALFTAWAVCEPPRQHAPTIRVAPGSISPTHLFERVSTMFYPHKEFKKKLQDGARGQLLERLASLICRGRPTVARLPLPARLASGSDDQGEL